MAARPAQEIKHTGGDKLANDTKDFSIQLSICVLCCCFVWLHLNLFFPSCLLDSGRLFSTDQTSRVSVFCLSYLMFPQNLTITIVFMIYIFVWNTVEKMCRVSQWSAVWWTSPTSRFFVFFLDQPPPKIAAGESGRGCCHFRPTPGRWST